MHICFLIYSIPFFLLLYLPNALLNTPTQTNHQKETIEDIPRPESTFAPSLPGRIKPNTMGKKRVENRNTPNKQTRKVLRQMYTPSALRYKNTRCIENHRNSFQEPHSLGVILVQDMSSPTRLRFGLALRSNARQYKLVSLVLKIPSPLFLSHCYYQCYFFFFSAAPLEVFSERVGWVERKDFVFFCFGSERFCFVFLVRNFSGFLFDIVCWLFSHDMFFWRGEGGGRFLCI